MSPSERGSEVLPSVTPTRRRVPHGGKRIVVLEHGAAGWSGALVQAAEHATETLARVGWVAEQDPALAIPEVLRELTPGAPLPREAVVVSRDVTAVCLDLPPTAGLPLDRVRGMVRWEIEPFVTADRFGGEAADRSEPLVCGWATGRRVGAGLLACALPATERRRIARALDDAGLRGAGFYPAGGCAAGILDEGLAQSCVVLEAVEGELTAVRVSDGIVVAYRAATAPAEVAAACWSQASEGEALVVAGACSEEVEQALLASGLAPEWLATHEGCSASGLAAARHALGLPGGERVPWLEAREARAPLFRSGRVRGALVCAGVLGLLALCDLGLGVWLSRAEARVARLTEGYDGGQGLPTLPRLRAEAQQAEELRAEVEALRVLSSEAHERGRVLDACSTRLSRLPALLGAVGAAAGADVALDALREAPDGTLQVEGFALDEPAIQRFRRDLARGLRPFGLTPSEPRVTRETGRLGRAGYGFQLAVRGGGA
ncbi:MAG: hypothetical protein KDD82_14690 [Planctomycetes bacterium]|nr:hypothetical protein [Planctomycetota bacterium]